MMPAVALHGGTGREPVTFADSATVRFDRVNDAQLDRYLDTDQWRGKAGGYNLYDRQAEGWPISVTGDPTTVVGLPMAKLRPVLAKHGVSPVSTHA